MQENKYAATLARVGTPLKAKPDDCLSARLGIRWGLTGQHAHENHRRLHGQTTALGGKSPRCARTRRAEAAGLQEPPFCLARRNERVETVGAAAIGATVAREMNELILVLNAAVARKTETGAAVKCLSGIHLLASKRAADRPQDQADIAFLEELKRLGKIA